MPSKKDRVREWLRAKIRANHFPVGELLPVTYDLAGMFKEETGESVCISTVSVGIYPLKNEGLITFRQGVGTTVVSTGEGLPTSKKEMIRMSELELPFVPLSALEKAFHQIPNYTQLLESCPAIVDRRWQNAVSVVCHSGWSTERRDEVINSLSGTDIDVQIQQVEYLCAWLGCYRPKHEDKLRVGGWLLSLMVTDCPVWSVA